ncbi:MAG: hypothetical protein EHJ94_07975 [Deltaproteobacteria bacterium]|nr:MAG: hypothetical protein EHJ94_07975 [Deltaproteobacteria bacterium]
MKEELASLLNKYYAGETNEEEEALLKLEMKNVEEPLHEKDIFSCYAADSILPDGIEKFIFTSVEEKVNKKNLRFRIYSLTSAAAAMLLLVTLYVGYQREMKTEKDFSVMEQALSRVSESLQPDQEEPEMYVLWVDNNVEIIIN